MQIGGIELSYLNQAFPILYLKFSPLKIHRPRRPKLLQGTVHAGYGHSERLSQLNKTDRCRKRISLNQSRGAGAIE